MFRYRVACAVDVWSDTAHLYWQFIGTGWDKPTSHAVITVHLPGDVVGDAGARATECDPTSRYAASVASTPLAQGDVRAWGHGPLNGAGHASSIRRRSATRCATCPRSSYVEGSILFPREAVPAGTPDATGAAPGADPRPGAALGRQRRTRSGRVTRPSADGCSLCSRPFRVAMLLLVLLAKARDRIQEVPKLLEQPPEPDAVQGALLWSAWRGHLSPQNAYRAQILRLVHLGAIDMRAEGMVTDPKDLTLHKRMEALDLPTKADQDFQMLLFGTGEDAVDEISILNPKPRPGGTEPYTRYRAWWDGARSRTGDALRRIQKGDARLESTTAFIVAGGAAGYGVWTAAWGLGGRVGWWLAPAALACLVPALKAIPARVDRPLRERVAKLAAFRRYLQRFSDLPNAPALAVVIWEQYLEWAVALGVADEVEKQVRALIPLERLRSPVAGGPTGLQGLSIFHAMNVAAPTLVMHSMASASSGSSSGGFGSSSSSSGFSSGGFSSGGGGGGGGTGGGAG